MRGFEVGLSLYIAGNLVILAQGWFGFSPRGREYRHNGRWAYLLVLALIGSFYVGLGLVVAGLIVLLTVYWLLPVLVFLIGHHVFRGYAPYQK